ncbi:MAG: AzlC family ABC transporter permease [Hyphomicrobiaceae bacterium]|nr:AzlC family ABC transporter permease [Hyphomicrobiaceae bacterium]
MRSAQETVSTPFITLAGVRSGFRLALPILPGSVVFALGFGAAAAEKGLTFLDTFLYQTIVFAGASQFVSLELWSDPMPLATALTMAAVVFVVNSRMMLMGAALRPWLGSVPAHQIYPVLAIMTDPSWLIALRYNREGGNDWGIFLGASIAMYVTWAVTWIPGYLAASAVPDPRLFGLDLIMPVFFTTLLVPIYRERSDLFPWVVAGIVAVSVQMLFEGYWFVLAGGLAGAIAGAFAPRRAPAEAAIAPVKDGEA